MSDVTYELGQWKRSQHTPIGLINPFLCMHTVSFWGRDSLLALGWSTLCWHNLQNNRHCHAGTKHKAGIIILCWISAYIHKKCCLFRRVLLLPSVFFFCSILPSMIMHSLQEYIASYIETSIIATFVYIISMTLYRWNHNNIYFIMH